MPQVIHLGDAAQLVPTSDFPHGHFPFSEFNPVQSSLLGIYDRDANFCVASCTASGKTCCAEVLLSHEVRVNKKKGLYVAPLKALAQEKIDDWSEPSHHFGDLKISIFTGDYVKTKADNDEADKSDLILMTSEMLASRARSHKSQKSSFLKDVGLIVVDESHLLADEGRGSHLEVGLMKLTQINPQMRVCFLSATMPNVKEVCGWLSSLNDKDTYFIESSYRPTKLNIHCETYYDEGCDYDEIEAEKVVSTLRIVEYYQKDKFIIFVHSKRTGKLMVQALNRSGIQCEFHSSELAKAKRIELEKKFKDPNGLRVIVATSTLSAGCNTPARRVVIAGVHRAMQYVKSSHIAQMCGRSGRPRYDPCGDAYVLLPESNFDFYRKRIKMIEPIDSTLLEYIGGKEDDDEENRFYKTLAFHLISEIHSGNVSDAKEAHAWFDRSFAKYQNQWFDSNIVEGVFESLVKCGAIKKVDEKYKTTAIGTIASMFYFSPFDVADYKRSFSNLFKKGLKDDDIAIAVALGNLDSSRFGVVSKAEREEMGDFAEVVRKKFGLYSLTDPAIKSSYAYWLLMTGRQNHEFNTLMRSYQVDFPRNVQVLQMIDKMAGGWNESKWLDILKLRIQYGCPEKLANLCQLPLIGIARAQKLWDAKIKTLSDVVHNKEKIKSIVNLSQEKVDALVKEAESIIFSE